MAKENQTIYRQVYNANDDESILAGTHRVTCIFVRRGLLAVAFNSSNELLSVHYSGYKKNRPVWELDFFEPLFAQEPLLIAPEKISKIFFCSSTNIVVPEGLYDYTEAEQWLKKVHFLEHTDEIQHYHSKEDKSYYVYALPLNIKALVRINCPLVPLIPLAAYQLMNGYSRGVKLHCFITNDEACVSLYHYGTLLWHRIFNYATAEDIAYEIRVVCEEHKINADKVDLACTTLTAAEYPVATALGAYFANITTVGGHTLNNAWAATLSLIKHSETCA